MRCATPDGFTHRLRALSHAPYNRVTIGREMGVAVQSELTLTAKSYVCAMPRGPKGERRPADVIGAAVMVGRIATGEIEDNPSPTPNRAKGGRIGGASRAKKLTVGQRSAIAKTAAVARWRKSETD
jgi:hypothetical protein